jgi:hypothetical protein
MRDGNQRAAHRTMVDAKLMEKTGLAELTLRRVRRAFTLAHHRAGYLRQSALVTEGICARFNFMTRILGEVFTPREHEAWLKYLEHTPEDLADMCRGDYPISPYMVRVYSALFGIKVDFLLTGAAPQRDRVGADIDVWPASAQ